jgi:hypothetical protein
MLGLELVDAAAHALQVRGPLVHALPRRAQPLRQPRTGGPFGTG